MSRTSNLLQALRYADFGIADIVRVALALPAVIGLDVSLRVLGFRRTLRLLELLVPRRLGRAPFCPSSEPGACRFVTAVDRAGFVYRPGVMCLRRSLAVHAWLRWSGVESRIVFGVSQERGAGMLAHAWVEVDGEPVFESGDVKGTALGSFSGGTEP